MASPFDEHDPDRVLAVLDLAQAMVRCLDGRIVYWARGAERLYGWTAQEAVGRISHELLATVFSDPLGDIEAALLAHDHWYGELEHKTRDGRSIRVVSHWALQRDARGEPVAIAEVNTDFGPQLRAEAARIRLAAIVESSQDAIIGKTLEGYVTDWNAAAEVLFGYAAAEIVGQPVTILFPPEQVADEAAILASIRRGDRVATFETVRRRRDGSDIPVAVTVSPIMDASGKIVGASTIVRDLRERLDRERRLAELQAELTHVSRLGEMGQLVAAVVHEVNQPLTAIGNYVGALRRLLTTGNSELVRSVVQKIADQNERAITIVRRLSDFVRKGMLTVRDEDLSGIVREAIELASLSPAAKGVVIKAQLADDAARVRANRVQIQQVLFNLMRNAIEAMEGRADRSLTIASGAAVQGMVEVSVADTGPGLPDEVRRKLFQPFVTTKPQGMGIGLSLCRSIIEAHHGRLEAESSPRRGTIFRFTLRCGSCDQAVPEEESPQR